MRYRPSEVDRILDNQDGLYFYRHKEATIYSRLALLCLARCMFLSHSPLRRDVHIRDVGELALRLQYQMKDYLVEAKIWALYRALHREAKANGLLNSRVRFRTSQPVRKALDSLVSWTWVARELKEEWERHGNRAWRRYEELSSGLNWEELEFVAECAAEEGVLADEDELVARILAEDDDLAGLQFDGPEPGTDEDSNSL